MREKRIANLYGYTGGNFAYNIYSKQGLSPALLLMQGGGRTPMIIEVRKIGKNE